MSPLMVFVRIILFLLYLTAVAITQEYIGDSCKDGRGRNGVIVLLRDCDYAREDLMAGIQPKHYGFQDLFPSVCCPITKPGDISHYRCRQYIEVCPLYFPIVGGRRVVPGEYPHMAAIGYGDKSSISWQCGGSLISERFVLTAAHCLSSFETGPARWILLGTDQLISSASSNTMNGQIHPVINIIKHPEYKPPSKYNDIALLEFGNAITPNPSGLVTKKLHPVCLPRISGDIYERKAYAAGWGRTEFLGDRSSDLLKVEVDLLKSNSCSVAFDLEIRTTKLLQRGIDSSLLCAGVLEGGKDTCQGDSGGPLQISQRGRCMFQLLGITSFGKVCAARNSPSVYTRVSAFIPWIESIVWPQ